MDHINYKVIFDSYESLTVFFSDINYSVVSEPGFFLIIAVLKLFNLANYTSFFLTFSLIALSIKFNVLDKITPFFFSTILIFYCNLYFLQEMTQIRTAIATGFLLWCLPDIIQKRPFHFITKVLLSTLFHYSSILFLPLYFLDYKKINKTVFSLIILVPVILSVVKFDIFSILDKVSFGIFSDKVLKYNELMDAGIHTELHLISLFILIKILLIIFLLWNVEILSERNKYSIICLKIYCLSLACFYLFYKIPVFAVRISELLGIVEIILIPMVYYIIKERFFAFLSIISIGFVFIINNLLFLKLLKPYF